MSRPLALPAPLRAWVEGEAGKMLASPGVPPVDFAAPPGEPALAPADGVSWRVFKNPLTLFVGGVAAVLLELAEPRVRAGVWEFSDFRRDPLARLQRTGLAAMVTVYGARSVAETMIAGIGRQHARVHGVTPAGEPYRADDPALLSWVQATAGYGFMEAYSRFVRPLCAAERDAMWAEGAPAAALYGADRPPADEAAWRALYREWEPRLEPSSAIGEFMGVMARVPALPGAARTIQPLLLRAAVDVLPDGLAARLGLPARLGSTSRALVRAAARAADRVTLRNAPPARACARLGLAADYLYR
ncbi:MAG: hypothetical protein AVDCRST_MAG39-325 [uncultured Sphingomonadaceae bacterium]|uniref:ER-bound oxygenase mpaB/mpaB'/Rubber oxygenase catalytic domain-containing protein n=1 Tax=uncultured Sphingomonadaceae bacterium TaxID=169976 RepID=A0A6J4S2U3_9SPHN|nr:MAG: hypothetical protein AVDCRST_MAG39-325 [uncultured Sphingomonadaceae bacterium]